MNSNPYLQIFVTYFIATIITIFFIMAFSNMFSQENPFKLGTDVDIYAREQTNGQIAANTIYLNLLARFFLKHK